MADEQLVKQVVDAEVEALAHDTDVMAAAGGAIPHRAATSSDWPPPPPRPADVEVAEGTAAPQRHAAVYAVVRRPTTSG